MVRAFGAVDAPGGTPGLPQKTPDFSPFWGVAATQRCFGGGDTAATPAGLTAAEKEEGNGFLFQLDSRFRGNDAGGRRAFSISILQLPLFTA